RPVPGSKARTIWRRSSCFSTDQGDKNFRNERRAMNSTPKYRLAESTLIEPLVNSWHAWTYLITPVPASLHLVHYQIPTMESYLSSPNTHAEAYRDPALVCGPFIGVPPERAHQV